jgi:hypothetical protein
MEMLATFKKARNDKGGGQQSGTRQQRGKALVRSQAARISRAPGGRKAAFRNLKLPSALPPFGNQVLGHVIARVSQRQI